MTHSEKSAGSEVAPDQRDGAGSSRLLLVVPDVIADVMIKAGRLQACIESALELLYGETESVGQAAYKRGLLLLETAGDLAVGIQCAAGKLEVAALYGGAKPEHGTGARQ